MTSIRDTIRRAAQLLNEGKLVAFPTETVYGLGGNALSDSAVAAIYAAKERPQFNPLIVHISSIEEAQRYAHMNESALKLARHFWPGPLTLVLRRRDDCPLSLLASAGMDTVALRMPAHPLAQMLLAEAGVPIAAPSANRSGRVSPTDASHVEEELSGRVAMILDGGPCPVGIESTVIDMSIEPPVILRPGSVTAEQLFTWHPEAQPKDLLQWRAILRGAPDDRMKSPGMLPSHYAPSLPVRLNATSVAGDEALLAFGNPVPPGALRVENLSPSGNLEESAANVFRMLRLLDKSGAGAIAVMPIPQAGLGIAINDRLARAAAPR